MRLKLVKVGNDARKLLGHLMLTIDQAMNSSQKGSLKELWRLRLHIGGNDGDSLGPPTQSVLDACQLHQQHESRVQHTYKNHNQYNTEAE